MILDRSLDRKPKIMSIIDSADRSISWRKASYSVGNGECVEVVSALGQVSIRDSKDPEGPVLTYSADAFRSFLGEAKRASLFP
jgi:Domain of unknown function (DUF397)